METDVKNLLIFPMGTEIAFEIMNALKYSKFVKIYGGTSVNDHSEYVCSNLIKNFPMVQEDGFLQFLNKMIEKYNIDCIYPAHDSVCVFLSKYADEIEAQVIITEFNTVKICRSKLDTYLYFQENRFIPKFYRSIEEITEYPVFVKPTVGQGSHGAKIIENREELINAINKDNSLVICEYLPGSEFTVDCFTDNYGHLRVIKLRDRQKIRNGICVYSKEIEVNDEIRNIAEIINRKLKFKGAWFFQVKENEDGEYRLLEISPRIPGTMGISRNLGINFPLLTLYVFWGYDVRILDNDYQISVSRALYSAYNIGVSYEYVYIDYDDTIIVRDKVNTDIIKFLYQCVNNGKKIYLLSKHKGDLRSDLRRFRIPEELFDDIIHIPEHKEKKDYIKNKNSIFIDDSFAEREQIKKAHGIPVFDLDMIESLIDWKY